MIVDKIIPSGGYCICEIVDNQLITRRYFGYTKKEAIQLFKQEVKKLNNDTNS